MTFDEIDRRILHELQHDGALSNVELARRVHLSPSPCLARVKALESAGVIQRYVALADAKATVEAREACMKVINSMSAATTIPRPAPTA